MEKEELTKKLSEVYQQPVKLWGPYECKDGRKRVDLLKIEEGVDTTHLFAKVVLEAKLGRRLSAGETVDHIDEDKTNDHPDNLQPLSSSDNSRKSATGVPLKHWIAERVGTEELALLTSGERNSLATLSNKEVRELREGFIEFGEINELAKTAPCNRKSLRAILEGRTYRNAGGPIVKFMKGSHERFQIAEVDGQ